MSKRMASYLLLVLILLVALPVSAAAPADRGVHQDGLAGYVQAVWEDLARFLGIGPQPVEPNGAEKPRSIPAQEEGGPNIDP